MKITHHTTPAEISALAQELIKNQDAEKLKDYLYKLHLAQFEVEQLRKKRDRHLDFHLKSTSSTLKTHYLSSYSALADFIQSYEELVNDL